MPAIGTNFVFKLKSFVRKFRTLFASCKSYQTKTEVNSCVAWSLFNVCFLRTNLASMIALIRC
jgi:hypothetical protein